MPSTLATPDTRFHRHGPGGRFLEVTGGGGPRRIALEHGIVRVGRGLGADLRLDDASVSRRHAVLVQRPDEVRLLDDRSAGGTFVNGRRVLAATLSDGDRIAVGDIVLTYREVA